MVSIAPISIDNLRPPWSFYVQVNGVSINPGWTHGLFYDASTTTL